MTSQKNVNNYKTNTFKETRIEQNNEFFKKNS